ncbi:MAG: UDP-3-O-(3-hydroxymyristoyl)glucosamine N-acyltransferase [Prevotellaceae bacterium]|jgi:UDP-3-O-[3-hydroxymyristoyl] glucosamine N-acyltransferase|nr:UDP-3-O-(3-hydroxymyristoyl)glucosamine N-acyltransferase [Prevotellaceae bacterium]
MLLTAQTIADCLNGDIEGDSGIVVSSVINIEQGKKETLCFLANPKYEKYLYTTQASIVLVDRDFVLKHPVNCTLIRVDNAYESMSVMLGLFDTTDTLNRKGREYPSRVSWRAKIGKKVYIGAFTYISRKAIVSDNVKLFPNVYIGEGVSIGENTIIYSDVKIYPGCSIGANCIIHSGCIIGSDGFGFAPSADGIYKKIPQTGNVIIEDNVEIGANTTVDRATMSSTIICKGSKLDNLIQIAHNVEIGENTIIAAHSGIAGSTKVGSHCVLAGRTGLTGHLTIGNNAIIGAEALITNNVKEGKSMLGIPAMEAGKFRRSNVLFRNLPEISKNITELLKQYKNKMGEAI